MTKPRSEPETPEPVELGRRLREVRRDAVTWDNQEGQ